MKFSYIKRDNSKLFSSLEKKDSANISKVQNYIPLYHKFFTLNQSNYNSINLDQSFSLYNISEKESDNKFEGTIKDKNNKKHTKQIFFKYSPLLDPIKYIIGKYDSSNVDLLNLPNFENINSHPKVRDMNNSAYVDSFFTYLTSKLLNDHKFIHGLDFYGSFLGIKHDFAFNVVDDIDYITESSFFHKNNGTLFTVDISAQESNYDTRNYKKRLNFNNDVEVVLQLSDIKDLTQLDSIFSLNDNKQNIQYNEPNAELIFENNIVISKSKNTSACSSASTCSSRSSNTDVNEDDLHDDDLHDDDLHDDDLHDDDLHDDDELNDIIDENNMNQEDSDKVKGDKAEGDTIGVENVECVSDDGDSEYSDMNEEELMAKITNFPVQIIALERCEGTLDSLIMEEDVSDDEWGSIVMQILLTLITLQQKFHLTHNDLHTNNIMYNTTNLEYLYYKLDGKYYKVPTYGRIYKIIDFGRAIYKFRGSVMCSDSFHNKGDAATQYNCEPYLNKNKPRLEPNYSFDLCRLGCALFDFILDEEEDDNEDIDKIKSPILKIIAGWCKDDKGRNIMYKNNGEERYPDFKLYKMIARTVTNHIPSKVIEHPYFDRFIANKKKIKLSKNQTIMDIDAIPNYTELIL
jgi:hypothetical protein